MKTGLLVLGWRGTQPMDPVPAGGERCTAVVQASAAIRPILSQTLWAVSDIDSKDNMVFSAINV